MWLFDTIFLDQENSVAIAEKPQLSETPMEKQSTEQAVSDTSLWEMFSPVGEETSSTSDPNMIILDESSETSADISFDIGGDIDFSETSTSDTLTQSEWQNTGTFIANGEIVEAPAEMIAKEEDMNSIAMIQWATNASGTLIVDGTIAETITSDEPIVDTEESVENSMTESQDNGLFGMLDTAEQSFTTTQDIKTESSPSISGENTVFPQPWENGEVILREWLSPLQEMLERYIRELKSLWTEEKNRLLETKEADIEKREAELKEEFETRTKAIAYEKAEIAREKQANTREVKKLERIIESLKKELV